jgi:hypothetical protein
MMLDDKRNVHDPQSPSKQDNPLETIELVDNEEVWLIVAPQTEQIIEYLGSLLQTDRLQSGMS